MVDSAKLSQIETIWDVVRQAHCDESQMVRSAQNVLLDRYGNAAHRYLLGALRDKDAADEVYQEFALRLVRGDFHRAAPERGRFRSFIKSILYRMVVDFYRKSNRNPISHSMEQSLEPVAPGELLEREKQFDEICRDKLLAQTWDGLMAVERKTGKPMYTTLRLRVDQPELRSQDLAKELSKKLERRISPTNARIMLHRARANFADLLLENVSNSLADPSSHDLEEELAELELLDYCPRALERVRENRK